jgi:hypothetical protein
MKPMASKSSNVKIPLVITFISIPLQVSPRIWYGIKQRDGLRSLLTERDELITLLARSDPAATDRLFAVYSTYNKTRE